MTTITIDRALLEQALEALDVSRRFVYQDSRPQVDAAFDALRAELAKPVEPAGSNLAGQGAAIYKQLVHATNRLLSSQNEPERFGCVGPSPSDIEYRNLMQIFQHVCTGIDSPPTPAWHDTPGVVWKATSLTGDTAHFGVRSAAKAWARSGTVEPVPLKHLRLVPLGTDCGPECRQCGMTCLRARQIDEQFAHRLSLAVEAMLIDPERNRTFAEKQLGEYEAAWAAINPGPATSMGEPVTSMGALANPKFLPGSPVEDYSDCHGPDWRDRDGEYLK